METAVVKINKNTTDIQTIIDQLIEQTGVAYIKQGEFTADFDYTIIPIEERAENMLYQALGAIKDINFPTIIYKENDLFYWKEDAWNLLANTESDFSTHSTGKPQHRGNDLVRSMATNTVITGASYNIAAFSYVVKAQISVTNPNNLITFNAGAAYANVENGKRALLIVENLKATPIVIDFGTPFWGCNPVINGTLTVQPGTKAYLDLSKSYSSLIITRLISDSEVQALITASVTALVNSAPATLDTLKELADALGDDPNFATTVMTALGNRELSSNKSADSNLGDSDILFPTQKAVKDYVTAHSGGGSSTPSWVRAWPTTTSHTGGAVTVLELTKDVGSGDWSSNPLVVPKTGLMYLSFSLTTTNLFGTVIHSLSIKINGILVRTLVNQASAANRSGQNVIDYLGLVTVGDTISIEFACSQNNTLNANQKTLNHLNIMIH